MELRKRDKSEPFITKDGSTIRSLMDRSNSPVESSSLAEAMVPPGGETTAHRHLASEEIYYFLQGRGRMRVDDEETNVEAGDCVLIPAGAVHKLWNPGDGPLVLLCICAPPYSHEDTVLEE